MHILYGLIILIIGVGLACAGWGLSFLNDRAASGFAQLLWASPGIVITFVGLKVLF